MTFPEWMNIFNDKVCQSIEVRGGEGRLTDDRNGKMTVLEANNPSKLPLGEGEP